MFTILVSLIPRNQNFVGEYVLLYSICIFSLPSKGSIKRVESSKETAMGGLATFPYSVYNETGDVIIQAVVLYDIDYSFNIQFESG